MTFINSKRLKNGCGLVVASLSFSIGAAAMQNGIGQNQDCLEQKEVVEQPYEWESPHTFECTDLGGSVVTSCSCSNEKIITTITTKRWVETDNFDKGNEIKKTYAEAKRVYNELDQEWRSIKCDQDEDDYDQSQDQRVAPMIEKREMESNTINTNNPLGEIVNVVVNHLDGRVIETIETRRRKELDKHTAEKKELIAPVCKVVKKVEKN